MRYGFNGYKFDNGNHEEMSAIYRLLKKHGYHGGGRTSGALRFWDHVFDVDNPRYGVGVCDAHRIYTNRYTAEWESANLQGGPCIKGTGATSLAAHLRTVKYERPEAWHQKNLARLDAIHNNEFNMDWEASYDRKAGHYQKETARG